MYKIGSREKKEILNMQRIIFVVVQHSSINLVADKAIVSRNN